MKIQHLLIATLGMCSSALVWAGAGDITYQPSNTTPSGWQNTGNVPKGEELEGITLLSNPPVTGALAYTIEGNGGSTNTFKIMLNGAQGVNTCYAADNNGTPLTNNQITAGSKVYQINAIPTVGGDNFENLICDVSISDTSAAALDLTFYQEIDLGQYCENTQLAIKAKQVELFKVGTKHYLALLIQGASGTCANKGNGANGVHIYEWANSQEGFKHKQHITTYDDSRQSPTRLEFVSIDAVQNYLAIAFNDNSATTANSGNSYIDLWIMGEGGSLTNKARVTTSDLTNVRGLKHVRENYKDYLVVTSEGTRLNSFRQFATIHPWTGSTFGQDNNKSITTMGASDVTHFKSVDGVERVIIANEHNESSYVINDENYNNTGTGVVTELDTVYSVKDGKLQNPQQGASAVETFGINKWEHFSADNRDFLIPANGSVNYEMTEGQYNIYEWASNRLDVAYNINALPGQAGLKDWKHVELNSAHFFFSALPNTNTGMIYTWVTEDEKGGMKLLDAPIPAGSMNNISTLSWDYAQMGDDGNQHYVFRLDSGMGANQKIAVQIYTAKIS